MFLRRRLVSRAARTSRPRKVTFEALESRTLLTTGLTGGDQPHDNYGPSLAVQYLIAIEGNFPAREEEVPGLGSTTGEVLIGEIRPWVGNGIPAGWVLADGQTLPILQNTALFSVLGNRYGGNGITHFAVPDLRGRTPIGAGQGSGLTNRVLGEQVGSATVTLTEDQLPAHQHAAPGDPTGSTGGGQAHDNMQPSLALNFIVAARTTGGFMPGEVRLFAGNFEPEGWEFADGEHISIADNMGLFETVGTLYGGNGSSTFGVPDLRGRFATNFGTGPNDWELGEAFGVETVTLTDSQIPTHSHTIPSGNTGDAGGGQAHQNLQPGLAINYVISFEGIFPTDGGNALRDPELTLSEIKMYVHNSPNLPNYWVRLDGSTVPIALYTALFVQIGTQFGGNGTTHFGLPDLVGRAPVFPSAGSPGATLGSAWGSPQVTLTVDQLPAHSHTTGPINDPPEGSDRTVTTLEDTPYVFTLTDFPITDPLDDVPNQLLAVRIATLPAVGLLTNNGVAVSVGDFVSVADIAAGRLRFVPAANGNGDSYASFTFQVQDDGGTLNGGVDLDPTPNTLTIDVVPVDFDFGDAPDSYGTTLAANGARHLEGSTLWLGTGVDLELDGLPNGASGDDSTGIDDEDGVQIAPGLLAGAGAKIVVTASAAGRLDAWIDFNRNGVFDPNEKIANNVVVAAGANELNVNVPAVVSAGVTYARFRISSIGGLGPTGPASDGEVEDYAVTLTVPTSGQIALVGDPLNPGSNLLFVNGTSTSDAIIVRPLPGNPQMIEVVMSPPYVTKTFQRSAVHRIQVNGNAGSDSIYIDPAIAIPTLLDGGADNDTIVGGSGPNIILGGDGVDNLAGGSARDLIIGGSGIDWIVGGGNDDILIGGNLAQASNLAALSALLASWNGPATFSERTAALAASLSAANVLDDGVADYVYGQAGRDWLLDFALRDYFFDYDANALTGDRRN